MNHPRADGTAAAVLASAHIGDINGALGTIRQGDIGPRPTRRAGLLTLIAIVAPGLIVMVGDNDAAAFGTYTQAGQNGVTRLSHYRRWYGSGACGSTGVGPGLREVAMSLLRLLFRTARNTVVTAGDGTRPDPTLSLAVWRSGEALIALAAKARAESGQ